jgi:inner membrane protein
VPTIVTHAALPLIAAWGLGPALIPPRLALAAAFLAVAPDLDIIGRAFAVPHYALLGHRGISHSLLVAALLALLALPLLPRARPLSSAFFLFAAAASHGLADMFTHGSKGIMLWWPLSYARYGWELQPIEASGILARSITDGSLPGILLAELLWLVLPALLLVVLYRLGRRAYIDLAKGQS